MARRNAKLKTWAVLLILLLFPHSAQAYSRIISLKPNLTEILFGLNVGEQIVGATTYCTRPQAAEKIPRVADYIRVNPEAVLKLQPDLILGSKENSSQKEIYFLMERGIPVQLFSFSTLQETTASIEKLGKLLGKEKQAKALVQNMNQALKKLKAQAAQVPKKRILFVLGYQPLVVAGSNNFFDEATQYLGATNVAGQSRLKYPTYTTERLIRSAPEVIIDLSMGSEKATKSRAERQDWWQRFASLPAVQSNAIYFFDIEKMRPTPILPQSFAELFQKIHK